MNRHRHFATIAALHADPAHARSFAPPAPQTGQAAAAAREAALDALLARLRPAPVARQLEAVNRFFNRFAYRSAREHRAVTLKEITR